MTDATTSEATHPRPPMRSGPLLSAGVLIGAGLGGFVDGILFHQILQFHNMLSARLPPNDLVSTKINMVWDGFFHVAVWIMTAIGVVLLFRAGSQRDVLWSGRVFGGAVMIGAGLFNVVEGLIDHHILQLHHVYEYTDNHWPADLAFLAVGAVLIALGAWLVRSRLRAA